MIVKKSQIINVISALVSVNDNLVEKIYVNKENKLVSKNNYYHFIKTYRKKILTDLKHQKYQQYLKFFPVLQLFKNNEQEINLDKELSVGLEQYTAFGALKKVEQNKKSYKEYDKHILWDLFNNTKKIDTTYKVEHYQKFYNYIKHDRELKKVIESLGGADYSKTKSKNNFVEVEQFLLNLPYEFHSFISSDDLRNIFYLELVNLKDPELEVLFYEKFLNKNLATFQYGVKKHEKVYQELRPNERKRFKGPLVVAIDTSGSMQDVKEIISKNIALLIVEICLGSNRDVVLMSYSTDFFMMEINYFDGEERIKEKVLEFLNYSYYGGTDVNKPLLKILEVINNNEKFLTADVVFLSDFLFKEVDMSDKKTYDLYLKFKKRNNKMIGIEINNSNNLKKVLPKFIDEHFIYFYNWNQNWSKEDWIKQFDTHFLSKKKSNNLDLVQNEENISIFNGFLRKVYESKKD